MLETLPKLNPDSLEDDAKANNLVENMSWGSCQYNSTAEVFGLLCAHTLLKGKEKVLEELRTTVDQKSPEKMRKDVIINMYSIIFSFEDETVLIDIEKNYDSFAKLLKRINIQTEGGIKVCPEDLLIVEKMRKDDLKFYVHERHIDKQFWNEDDEQQMIDALCALANMKRPIEAVLDICRNQSYDLFCAAPQAVSLAFEEVISPIDTHDVTGFACWLVHTFGLVQSIDYFQEWDT